MAMMSIAAAHPVFIFPLQHYPSRLHRLYLVDVPTLLKWLASGVLQILQPETRAKASLAACCVKDRRLPQSPDFVSSIQEKRQALLPLPSLWNKLTTATAKMGHC